MYLINLTLAGLGILGTAMSIVIRMQGNDPTQVVGGLWVIVMILGLLAAEIMMYWHWRRFPATTPFISRLHGFAPVIAVFAIAQFFSNDLLYLIVLAVTIFSWNRVYTETGLDLNLPSSRLTAVSFVRIVVRPLVGFVFFVIIRAGGNPSFREELLNAVTGIVIVIMIMATYRFSGSR